MSSIDPRGLDAGARLRPPDEAPGAGDGLSVGAARGTMPVVPRSALIALENEAREVFEIMAGRVPANSLPDR